MNINVPGQRNVIALKWSGKDPILLPKATMEHERVTLKPGVNEDVPIAYWKALGAYPEVVEMIASGAIAAVCTEHVFPDAADVDAKVAHVGGHCRYCGLSRARDEAERSKPTTVTKGVTP